MEALTFGGKWSLVNPYGEMWIGKWLQSHSAYRMNYICWDADAVPCLQITDYSRCIWKIMHLKKFKMTNNFTNNLEWREYSTTATEAGNSSSHGLKFLRFHLTSAKGTIKQTLQRNVSFPVSVSPQETKASIVCSDHTEEVCTRGFIRWSSRPCLHNLSDRLCLCAQAAKGRNQA